MGDRYGAMCCENFAAPKLALNLVVIVTVMVTWQF